MQESSYLEAGDETARRTTANEHDTAKMSVGSYHNLDYLYAESDSEVALDDRNNKSHDSAGVHNRSASMNEALMTSADRSMIKHQLEWNQKNDLPR